MHVQDVLFEKEYFFAVIMYNSRKGIRLDVNETQKSGEKKHRVIGSYAFKHSL